MISKAEQGVLLFGAREALRTIYDQEYPYPSVNYQHYPGLQAKSGTFVTLTLEGELRGCIGFVESETPLFQSVCDAAILAATDDPRFNPLTPREISQCLIEISVLSQPVQVRDYTQIVMGVHGLILNEQGRSALLLPQVAKDYNMTIDQFLTALCQKAGLPAYYWNQKFLNLRAFEALVFGEVKHRNVTGERT